MLKPHRRTSDLLTSKSSADPRSYSMENTKGVPEKPQCLWNWDCRTSCHQDLMQISFLGKKASTNLFGIVVVWKEHIADSDHYN